MSRGYDKIWQLMSDSCHNSSNVFRKLLINANCDIIEQKTYNNQLKIMKFIGLDAGSVSVKLVLLDDKGKIQNSLYQRHKGRPLPVALEMLKTVMSNELCVTGRT